MAVPAKRKNSLLPLGFFLFDSRESSLLEYELAKPSQPTTRNHILNFSNARLSVDSVVSVTLLFLLTLLWVGYTISALSMLRQSS